MFTALGVATGQTIWALATSLGIVALLVASEPLFLAVKVAGAGYLIYLGIQALREALRPATAARGLAFAARGDRRLLPLTAFRQGLVSDLGNPKIAVFFASLLPQFVPVGDTSFWHLLFLGIVFALIALAWLTLYATAMAIFEEFLRRSAVRRVIAGVTGTVLVGLGPAHRGRTAIEPQRPHINGIRNDLFGGSRPLPQPPPARGGALAGSTPLPSRAEHCTWAREQPVMVGEGRPSTSFAVSQDTFGVPPHDQAVD